jgi:hypothetical protein
MKKIYLLLLFILSIVELKAVKIDTLHTHYFPILLDTAIVSNDYLNFFTDGNFPTVYYLKDGKYTFRKIPFSTDKYYFDYSNNIVGFDTTTFIITYYDFSQNTMLTYDLSNLKIYNHYRVSFFSSNYMGFVSKATNKALLFSVKTKELVKEFPEIDNSIYDNIFLSANEKYIITFKRDTISKFNIATQETEYSIQIPALFSNAYNTLQPNDSIMIFYDYHNLLTFDIKNGKLIYSEKEKDRVGYYKRVYGDNQLLYFYTASNIIKPIFVNYYNGETKDIENTELYKTGTTSYGYRRSIIAPYVNGLDTISARIEEITTTDNKNKSLFYKYSISEQKPDTIYSDYITDYTFNSYIPLYLVPKTNTFYNNSNLFKLDDFQVIDTIDFLAYNSIFLLDSTKILFKKDLFSNDSAVYIYDTESLALDTIYKSKELCDYKQFRYNPNFKIEYNNSNYLVNRITNDTIYSASGLTISFQGTCFYHKYLENSIKHLKIIVPSIENPIVVKDFILNDTIINNPYANLSPDGKYLAYCVNGSTVIYNILADKYDTINTISNIKDYYFFGNSQYLQIFDQYYFDTNTGFDGNGGGFLVIDLNSKEPVLDFYYQNPNVAIVSSLNEDYCILLHFNKKNKFRTFYRLYKFSYDNLNISESYNTLEGSSFSIYPNPVKTQLTISSNDKNLNQIEIYNSLGKLIYIIDSIYSNEFNIDISAYPCGTYYIKSNNTTQIFVIER